MTFTKTVLLPLLSLVVTTAALAAPVPPMRPADIPPAPAQASKSKPPVYQAACPALMGDQVDAEIQPPIDFEGCGTQSPYQLNAIRLKGQEIKLATPVTLNCAMATAFIDWVERVDRLSRATHNAGLEQVSTGTSYMCRRRNNSKTGKISEHGFANAVDLTGFVLTNGKNVQLPDAWQTGGKDQKLIRQSHKLGCKIFTTVLGPEANALHKDHLHLDMGCHGKSCTYTICD